jgi:biotin operon repressor
MLYQRSLDIERRLQSVLELIGTGKYSTPDLARELRVSIPTVSRDVTALRERGHDIRAEKRADGWRYVLTIERVPQTNHKPRRADASASSRPMQPR